MSIPPRISVPTRKEIAEEVKKSLESTGRTVEEWGLDYHPANPRRSYITTEQKVFGFDKCLNTVNWKPKPSKTPIDEYTVKSNCFRDIATNKLSKDDTLDENDIDEFSYGVTRKTGCQLETIEPKKGFMTAKFECESEMTVAEKKSVQESLETITPLLEKTESMNEKLADYLIQSDH